MKKLLFLILIKEIFSTTKKKCTRVVLKGPTIKSESLKPSTPVETKEEIKETKAIKTEASEKPIQVKRATKTHIPAGYEHLFRRQTIRRPAFPEKKPSKVEDRKPTPSSRFYPLPSKLEDKKPSKVEDKKPTPSSRFYPSRPTVEDKKPRPSVEDKKPTPSSRFYPSPTKVEDKKPTVEDKKSNTDEKKPLTPFDKAIEELADMLNK